MTLEQLLKDINNVVDYSKVVKIVRGYDINRLGFISQAVMQDGSIVKIAVTDSQYAKILADHPHIIKEGEQNESCN